MAKSTIQGQAVQIADIRNNKLIIDTKAFNRILDKVGKLPLSVVSVNGPLRSGKSYILSHFLKYLSKPEDEDWFDKIIEEKFHWQNSADRQTTGILVWSEPYFITRNDKEIAILLLDTQGCFDDQTTGQQNSAIFALSCLLSSVLIFNVKNLISEEIYQNLQMFIGYASMTKGTDESGDIDEWQQSCSDAQDSFSKLVFLVRDWQSPKDYQFGYYDDNTKSGSKNFKKEKVDVKDEMASEARVVRKAILESFENVACCLMPYPGNELAWNDIEDDLQPEFIKIIKDFLPRLFDAPNICIKSIGGAEISGDDFKRIVQKWAKCFNEYDFPEVSTVAEASAKFQNQKALSIALKVYRQNMNKDVEMNDGLSDEQIVSVHDKNRTETIAAFNRMKRIRMDDIKNQYLNKLENHIEEAFETYQKMNYVKRLAIESGKKSEVEMNQLKEELDKMSQQLERSQDLSTSALNVNSGQYSVKIINMTDFNITLYWKNHHFWNEEHYEVEPEVTKIFAFYGYDNVIWSTLYRAKVTQHEKKEAKFWAFGNGAPRKDNCFIVRTDGVYLDDHKHSNWSPIKLDVVEARQGETVSIMQNAAVSLIQSAATAYIQGASPSVILPHYKSIFEEFIKGFQPLKK